jgi:hypothetical protein
VPACIKQEFSSWRKAFEHLFLNLVTKQRTAYKCICNSMADGINFGFKTFISNNSGRHYVVDPLLLSSTFLSAKRSQAGVFQLSICTGWQFAIAMPSQIH